MLEQSSNADDSVSAVLPAHHITYVREKNCCAPSKARGKFGFHSRELEKFGERLTIALYMCTDRWYEENKSYLSTVEYALTCKTVAILLYSMCLWSKSIHGYLGPPMRVLPPLSMLALSVRLLENAVAGRMLAFYSRK